ncbi:MAG: hypothetical protein JNM50_00240 [Chromatiales bacterium]|nr:hypothetical protein [Chromatiales bacterium]
MTSPSARTTVAAALALALAATPALGLSLGKKKAEAPAFDANGSLASQASAFIAPNKAAAKNMKDVNKVAITSCNVMFAYESNASAGTQGGLFSEAGGVTRAEATVSAEYTLHGMDEAAMQALAAEICEAAEAQVKAAGFEVVPADVLAANEDYQGIHANAKPVPYEYKAGGKGTKSRYLVYAPPGQGVYDPRFIGVSAGLGSAMKAAKGTSPQLFEGRVMDTLQADAMNINLLVDFAAVESDGSKGGLGGLASKDSAKVDGDARLSVSGSVKIVPRAQQECWDRFGKRECMVDANKIPEFNTATPVISADPFYKDFVNETSTGDKVGSAVSKGIAVLGAMGGVGGRSYSIKRYGVYVEPAQYSAEVKKYSQGFIGMALESAKAAKQ